MIKFEKLTRRMQLISDNDNDDGACIATIVFEVEDGYPNGIRIISSGDSCWMGVRSLAQVVKEARAFFRLAKQEAKRE